MRKSLWVMGIAIIGSALLSLGTASAAPATMIKKDGTYRVGVDIVAGVYHTDGGEFCYWERKSGLGGSFDEIIANGITQDGPVTVAIGPSDVAFETQGCGTWVLQG